MRYLIFLVLFGFCTPPKSDCSKQLQRIKSDSIELAHINMQNSELSIHNIELRDSLKMLKSGVDTIKTQLFLSNYKVERVKYYLNIVKRDKTQEVFLRGWVTRAIE